jgi:thioredoxin reductase
MTDASTLILALTGLAGLAMASYAGLVAFTKWIELKRCEIDGHRGQDNGVPSATNRIEIADLKERLRKLEAIAAGVDY